MKPALLIAIFVLLILLAPGYAAADGQAWKFRSDLANTGIYENCGTRPDGTLLWNYTTGSAIRSSPTVANGVVYVGCDDFNLYAIDTDTGDLLWKYTTEREVRSSPAVVDGVVYIASGMNTYALDADTGDLLWNTTTLPVPWLNSTGYTFQRSSPAVEDGVVYYGDAACRAYAFDAPTGILLWNSTMTPPMWDYRFVESSPSVADGVVYVGNYDDNLYALDASTGGILWNYTTGDRIFSSPAVADGVVYVGSGDNTTYALDASTGDLLWDYTTGGSVISSPAVADGVVYVGSGDNTAYALDASTGDLLWDYTTGGRILSSPAVADGVVYIGSLDNTMYAFDAFTGDLLWSYTTGDQVYSSPAVVNGIVYFGSDDGTLYAIGATPGDLPTYDDFDDNVCNSTIWDIIEYGGPYVNETDQHLVITIPADSSADTFYAGIVSKYALRGDFDIQVDYQLLTWPPDSGVRAGLWIERPPTSFTVERVSYSSSDYFTKGDHYTTNFADSILLSVTNDTDGKLRLVRTGTAIDGYCYDENSGNWVLLQSVPESAISTRDVTFMIRAWGHDYSFGDELVQVSFDNVVINKGELVFFSPPTGVTNLQNTTYQPTQIRWTWNDPGSIDFSHVEIYLDGVFQANVTAGTGAWTAKGLLPSTAYTIGTRTVGEMDAINGTWVNHTATTSSLSISHLDPPAVYAGSPAFTLNVSGTGYSSRCIVLWNGDERLTQFLDPGHVSIEVPAGMVLQPALVNITVYDGVTGEFSNPVYFPVRDSTSGAMAWKFRSDSSNSGVYDDGGTRPGNELLWKYMTESYYGSSPAVVDGVVYICGIYDTLAMNAFTGQLLWDSPHGGGLSCPAVADNVVYVGSSDRNISALDASTGALLWHYRTGGIVYSSPAVYNGIVYAGSWDHTLYALDAATGILLWDYPTGGEVSSSPAVANGVVYFGSSDCNAYALDAHTGEFLWKYTTGGELYRSTPAVVNGVVYIQSEDGNLYALDAATGSCFWHYPVSGWGDSSPAIAHGVVYIGSDDGTLYALDAVTGDLVWDYATGESVRSSPSVANGVVYVGSNTGSTYALDAGTGDLLWEFTTDETGFSSPAIANGVVYIQGMGTGYLYALAILPNDPPASVTGLHPTMINGAEITWAWTDPGTLGFSRVMIYVDGVFQDNVTAGEETWTATGLSPSTTYTIGTRTIGVNGLVNSTLVTSTATTGSLSISALDPASVVEDDPAFTLDVHGSDFSPSCRILWNGMEQSTSYIQQNHISMEVPDEFVAHSRRVNITVYDPISRDSSNAVILHITDNPVTAMGRKFRSDLNNTGVYDDGGRRPVPSLLWTYKTGAPVTSSPSVVDGVVYVGSQDRNLYALNATTGAFLWNYNTMERNDIVSSSPAVSNGVVYIGGLKTKIHAVDAYSGELLWKYKLPIRTTTRSGVSSSAAVADGIIYVGNMDGTVYAFDEECGDLIWSYAIPSSMYDEHRIFSSPAVVDGVVYIHTFGGYLYALDASSGTLLWDYLAEDDYTAYSSPSVEDGAVYVGSGTAGTFHAFDALTGDLLWEFPLVGSAGSSPAVSNGVVYFGCNAHTAYALDADTGAQLWNFTTGGRVISSPAVANGIVYFGSCDKNIYALDAVTGDFLWNYTTGGEIYSSPSVINGVVYTGSSDGNVYAIGTLPLDPPVADFSASVTSGNAPLDVEFTDTSTGVVTTRFWDFGDGATEWANGSLSVSHTYPFPGTYNVSLTAANADAGDTETKTGYIQVSPVGAPPRALFTVSPFFGYGPLTVGFRDRSTGAPTAWKWDFGDGNTSSEQTPTHTYMTVGRYSPTLTVSNSGGSSSYSFSVWVRERPVIPTYTPVPTFTTKPTIPPLPGRSPIAFFAINTTFGYAPMSVQFTDMSFHAPASWQWNFGDGHASTLQNPVNTYTESGTYSVSLTVTNAYGESTTSRRVYVR